MAAKIPGNGVENSGAFTIGAAGTSSSIAGLPIYVDSTNGSVYTHDVSGTDDTAQNNTAFGLNAADAITTADSVTVFGKDAGGAVTEGSSTTCFGKEAGKSITTATNNICIGVVAGSSLTTGGNNIAIGAEALDAEDTGTQSIAIGRKALTNQNFDSDCNNVCIGHEAGELITTGRYNHFIGSLAGDDFDTESSNMGIGYRALGGSIAGGEYNVAIGNSVLDALTSGDSNTAVGYYAGSAVTTGTENVLIGQEAGIALTEGGNNVCVGEYTANNLTTGDYNTTLGNNNTTDGVDAQHQITIGYGIGSNGDNNFTFGKAGNRVYNNFSSNASWTRSSDERKKQNIKDDNLGLNFINELRPVTFQWKPSNEFPKEWDEYSEENNMDTEVVMHGLIAQEVKSALDKVGIDTFGGWTENKDGMQNISREMFVFPLIKAVQELSAKVKELESK